MESKLRLRLGPDRKRAFLGQIRADCHVPPPPTHTHLARATVGNARAGGGATCIHGRATS